jgi:hypothetical protein
MDNRYHSYGCPALMQDGRFITNYTDSRIFEQNIRKINNIESAHDYRTFLQENAETLMNREREVMIQVNSCQVNGECKELS